MGDVATPDYYAVLGVSHDATPAQIKAAYRKAARIHHPDLNAADPEALARFKTIQEAYETLSRAAKRHAYDNSLNAPAIGLGGLGDLEDLFGTIFGTPFAPAAVSRYALTLTLREAGGGGAHSFVLPDGQQVNLNFPPGVEDGTSLTYGHLQIEVHVLPDPNFQILGKDLFTTVSLPLRLALNGGELPVATLRGQVSLKIPPGTQSGTRFRLRSQGMPDPRSDRVGDLYVQANLVVPVMDAALKRWAKRMPAPSTPI
jgi:DnaJ-class molecular chaperone